MLKRFLSQTIVLFITLILFTSCDQKTKLENSSIPLPLTERAQSIIDTGENKYSKAANLALRVLDSMGGEKAWQESRYISWEFIGIRRWLWDKYTGDVRFNSYEDNLTVLMNLESEEGKAFYDKEQLNDPDSLNKILDLTRKAWVNDSYWLVMPFKLLEPGVVLSYLNEKNDMAGNLCDVIEMHFDSVGYTPQNKYDIYIDKETSLVSQWTFYPHYDSTALFSTPWQDYKKYGDIYLTGFHGTINLSHILVTDSLNRDVFTKLEVNADK